nr:MAG TPA: hypothetical protein [Caudoviricetes sp.]
MRQVEYFVIITFYRWNINPFFIRKRLCMWHLNYNIK